jgi:4-alpha-glucanotransferase
VEEADYQNQWAQRRDEIGRLESALAAADTPGDAVAFVLSTPAQVVILNQEDLTGETEQQNLPASTWQHRNWSRKMRVPVEELGPIAERLAALIRASGRGLRE